MSNVDQIQTRVLVSKSPSGPLRPFADQVDIEVSSHGAPWDDTLAVELHRLEPFELEDCYISRTMIIQPTANRRVTGSRLKSRRRYESGLVSDVIHIDPSGTLTGARWTEPLSVLFLMPSDQTFQRVLGELRSPPSNFELVRTNYARDEQIRQIGFAALAECQSGFSSGRLYGESLAIALAARLVSCYSSRQPNFPAANNGLPAWRLRRVTDFIEENLDSELGLAELAAVAQFSEYHFSRMFKQSTGSTPHRYVMERRIERAKELLAHSQISIKEISNRVGFGDQAHLTTVFKRLTGVTPKQFREQTA